MKKTKEDITKYEKEFNQFINIKGCTFALLLFNLFIWFFCVYMELYKGFCITSLLFPLYIIQIITIKILLYKKAKNLYRYNAKCHFEYAEVKLVEPFNSVYEALTKLKNLKYQGQFNVKKEYYLTNNTIEYTIRGNDECFGSITIVDTTGTLPEEDVLKLDFTFLDNYIM